MINLNDVSIFLTAVGKKNFSAAARELNLSPSAVSKRISRLENELRAKLIIRSSRRISLTSAGSIFFQNCAGVLPMVDAATKRVQGVYNEPGGRLRVHTLVGVGTKLIAPLMSDFRSSYPSVSIELITYAPDIQVVGHGSDMFIVTGDPPDKTFQSKNLGACRYVVCASPAYLRRAGTPKKPSDLKDYECLLYFDAKKNSPLDEWQFIEADKRHTVKVSGALSSNNSAAIYEMLVKGYGIALLPVFAVYNEIRSGKLTALFYEEVALRQMLRACYPRSRHVPANVRLFVQYVGSHLRNVALDDLKGAGVLAAKKAG